MLDDLDHVFRNIGRYPVENDVRIAFNRVLLHSEFYADEERKRALADFESFGKIVLMQDTPAKPFFQRRFSQAVMALALTVNRDAA